MRHVLRHATTAAAVGSLLLLTGCSTLVSGIASAADPVTDVSAEEFPITGATDSDVDRRARNALADLNTFWGQAYPEFYGGDLTPLQGGYFSVDADNVDESLYPPTGVGCPGLPIDPIEVESNAFYQEFCDVIVYDSSLLEDLGEQHGPFLGPAVMAHEFGHAMQGRFGFSEVTIRDETQADCFAGAFTRWVVDGNAEHVALRESDLDAVLVGFIELRDPVGLTDETVEGAHGSGFDRVSGFFAGYTGGVGTCRDEFGPDRIFTAAAFEPGREAANEGNADYEEIGEIVGSSLPLFYDSWFPQVAGEAFEAPAIEGFDGTAPDCGDLGSEDRDLGFCESDSTVYADETDLLVPAYEELGDFAVATAVSLPYAQAARSQLGLSIDDSAATVSTVCLTGWYTARFFSGDFSDTTELSPGDVDEAILFLLAYGRTDSVLPNVEASGFELVGAFRSGFLQGGTACDLGF
ncbi:MULTISPECIES: neutral zinc metallopeptidase [unclassified Geodermatophilus]|uniref:neutral zinc metallopeptidase n=1 Tax=unclassified Geodermatophilus TaxID=2637632 RepID=UPI003EE8D485